MTGHLHYHHYLHTASPFISRPIAAAAAADDDDDGVITASQFHSVTDLVSKSFTDVFQFNLKRGKGCTDNIVRYG